MELYQYKKLVKRGQLNDIYVENFLIKSKRVFENPALELVIIRDFKSMNLG